jgi:hypothetical protein
MKLKRQHLLITGLLLVLLTGYWLLPISGDVFIMLDEEPAEWPRIRFEPETPRPGEVAAVILADTVPWVHVKVLIDGQEEAQFLRYESNPLGGEWFWSFTVPTSDSYELRFYHDCDQGCVDWASKVVNTAVNTHRFPAEQIPTKLGVVFPNPERDWHNRSGWVVELTYAQLADAAYWGLDDLAARVQQSVTAGHRVLLRVDYDQTQSIPHDEAALADYLDYVRRLARDDRLNGAYAFVIGSSYNVALNSQQGLISPDWYARVFNGYGTAVTAQDNVQSIIRAENPALRVLIGPVQPWVLDRDGERPFEINAPWLNYFYTLVSALDDAAQARTAAGIAQAAPDGFAIQAPGSPDSPKLTAAERPLEPGLDLISQQWNGAQIGFRVYQDWQTIINSTLTTQGKPIYITASNTFGADHTGSPAANYPSGWLTAALTEINRQPQIYAFCWFVDDFDYDQQWQEFSLSNPQGAMIEAAREFDVLLEVAE